MWHYFLLTSTQWHVSHFTGVKMISVWPRVQHFTLQCCVSNLPLTVEWTTDSLLPHVESSKWVNFPTSILIRPYPITISSLSIPHPQKKLNEVNIETNIGAWVMEQMEQMQRSKCIPIIQLGGANLWFCYHTIYNHTVPAIRWLYLGSLYQ